MKKKLLIVFLICCIMFGVASPAFAADELPAPNSSWENYFIFSGAITSPYSLPEGSPVAIVFPYETNSTNANLVTETFSRYNICYDPLNMAIRFILTPSVGNVMEQELYYRAYYYDGSSWVRFVGGGISTMLNSTKYTVSGVIKCSETDFYEISLISDQPTYLAYYSQQDNQYTFSDTVFPVAPPDPMVTLAEQMMKETQTIIPTLDGNLQILVPFGIICLALLVGLVLLRKIFRTFLG